MLLRACIALVVCYWLCTSGTVWDSRVANYVSPKVPLPPEASGFQSNTWFLGPILVNTPVVCMPRKIHTRPAILWLSVSESEINKLVVEPKGCQ